MKTNFVLLCLFLSSSFFSASTCFGQKVDIDNTRIYVEYASLPTNYIEPEKRTYSVDIAGSYEFEKDDILEQIMIRGWEKTEDNPTAVVKIKVSDFVRGKSSSKKRTEEKKDKNGKVTSRTTYYKYVSTNNARAAMSVYGPLNKAKLTKYEKKQESKKSKKKKKEEEEKAANPFLKDVKIDTPEDESGMPNLAKRFDMSKEYPFETKEYKSIKQASSAYSKDIAARSSEQLEDFNVNIGKRASYTLNSFYGYNRTRDWAKFKKLDSKKHPENEMYNNAMVALKEILGKKRFNTSHDEVAAALQPIITYFESTVEKYSKDDKHHKRLKAASMYNLAQIHYYLDNTDKVTEIGDAYIKWDHDKKDGEKFVKKALELKELLTFHNMTGRFYETSEDADTIEATDIADEGGE